MFFFDVKTEILYTAVQAGEILRASNKPLLFEKISLCSKRVKNSFIDKVLNKYWKNSILCLARLPVIAKQNNAIFSYFWCTQFLIKVRPSFSPVLKIMIWCLNCPPNRSDVNCPDWRSWKRPFGTHTALFLSLSVSLSRRG